MSEGFASLHPAAPALLAAAILGTAALGGCVSTPTSPLAMNASSEERDCMARAMYFESNRSSQDGMLAVGTVVMNRLQSSKYPKTICGVVGAHRQFANGVLTKPAEGRSFAMAQGVADAVLKGDRHDEVGAATHFHTAGHTFPYRNMFYVAKAGGNVFYEKKEPGTFTPVRPHTLIARDEGSRGGDRERVRLAAAADGGDGESHPRRRGRAKDDDAARDGEERGGAGRSARRIADAAARRDGDPRERRVAAKTADAERSGPERPLPPVRRASAAEE